MNFKDLKISKRTSKITLDNSDHFCSDNKIKALCILLGAYNKFGRDINLETYKKLKNDFDNLIYKLEQHLNG